jgi:hypothetical protein
MKDVELPLRKAYVAALAGISCPVYYQQLPSDISVDEYVLITIPTSADDSTKTISGTDTTVRVGIYTHSENGNNGVASATIANAIYAAILPTPSATLPLDNLQMLTTVLRSDNTESFTIKNSIVYIDRFINFTHKINHK